jgi:NHL repeat
LAASGGPLVVADTGHHRLLIWDRAPATDLAPADIVIGQPSFEHEGRNGKGDVGSATLNVPTGVTIEDGVLAVADAWNHRVLIWNTIPTRNNQPADIVLGQEDFSGALANRGGEPGAHTLNWCYGISLLNGRLFVADTGNRRVLVWDQLPARNGQPADRVLGQTGFTCRDENAGRDAGPLGMRWPHAVACLGASVAVSDAGNNRIMVWRNLPVEPGVPCDFVLGQADMTSLEHNRARYMPEAASLNMPYAIANSDDWLLAADTANSRLVGWRIDDLAQGAPARFLTGQRDFGSKGDNRWQMPVRDSLCWPYGLDVCGSTAVVSDSGNNRVLLWELAS